MNMGMEYKKALQEQLESLRETVRAEHADYKKIVEDLENGSPKPETIGVDKYFIEFDLSILDDVPATVEELEEELENYEQLLASIQKLIDDIRKATAGIAQFTRFSMPMLRNTMPNLDVNQIVGVQPMMNGNISVPYTFSKDIDSIDGSILED